LIQQDFLTGMYSSSGSQTKIRIHSRQKILLNQSAPLGVVGDLIYLIG